VRVTIYVPDDLGARLPLLPKGSISGICQEALRRAVERADGEYDDAIRTAFEED
jgi:hypothetical protein